MKKSSTPVIFPILETSNLILREIEDHDTSILHRYWTDKDVIKYFTLEPFKSIEETINMIALLKSLPEEDLGFRWAIVSKKDDTVLGTCGFHNVRSEHHRAEMGYELGKEFWGLGIMSEALKAVIDYGFHDLQYNRIEAFVNVGNDRSAKVLKTAGFHLDGVLREYEFSRGGFVDQYCYSLLKSDYTRMIPSTDSI